MESLGFDLINETMLDTLILDVIKSSEIEGEYLNPEQVRSSIARRLGMEIAGSVFKLPDKCFRSGFYLKQTSGLSKLKH